MIFWKEFFTRKGLAYLKDFVRSKLPLGVSFTIPPITSVFVLNSLRHLPTGKAVGLDGLSGYFLKLSAPSIASSLTTIFNLSLSLGSFPGLWKKAKVSPIFKDGSLFDRSNYRPISVLAILSKILERHVHISFYNFLTENDLLSDSQFGFRKSRSCELAVTDLIDRLLNNMDNGVLNGLLLVDLRKAFDLVNHSILLSKLQIYGCSSSTVQWFASYLSDRFQCTNFKGTLSDPLPVSIGVPQGSILGLLITTPQKFHSLNDHSLKVMINGKLIEQVQHAKLLGVTLDCHLTWEKHIDNICSIVNSRLSLLRRIKPFLNHHCALRFFNSCIHNLFIYCSSAWDNCSSYLLSRLLRLQKRAARLLLDADFTEPSVSLFSKLKWLPIFDLIKLRKLVILFTILNNPDAPLCLKRKFNFLSSVRSAGLRTRACAFNLHVPYPRSNSGKCTFAYSAATLFNCLDTDLKQIACVSPSSIIFHPN